MAHASLFVLAALLAPSAASAQPMDTYGLGSRAIAMGGAVTADVEDFSANYYNPAGIARGEYMRVAVGWFAAQHELSMNGLDSNVDPIHGLVTGLVVPGRIDDFRFGFGLAVHLNDDHISRTRSLPRTRPRWELYDNRPHRTFLAAHVAIRPWDWLSIGGGIAFLSYSENDLYVRGALDIVSAEARSRLEHEITADLSTIRYPQAGIQVMPIPEISVGLVYRGQFALDNTLRAEVEADLTGFGEPFPGYFSLLTQSVNAFVPQQLSLGVTYAPTPEFRVSAELTWVNWSAYVSPVGTSEVVLDIDLPPDLAEMIRVPDTIEGSTPIPAHFEDRFVPRLGAEGVAYRDAQLDVLVRGGFFYEQSPAPAQIDLTNLIDTDRLTWSLGAGLRLTNLRPLIDGFLQFDLHLQYAFMPERVMRKSSLVDTVGDYRASGHIFGGGLTMELGFR